MFKKFVATALVACFAVPAMARPQIRIFYSLPWYPTGVEVIKDGQDTSRLLVRQAIKNASSHKDAYKTLVTTTDFFETQFGRRSYDGQNSEIKATVGLGKIDILPIFSAFKQNAAWASGLNRFLFGAGGSVLDNFEKHIDVVAHEYTHAIVDTSSRLKYEGEAGALNESFADVFGEMAEVYSGGSTQKWLIGENVLTENGKRQFSQKEGRTVVALRDMMNPEKGLDKQPSHVSQIPKELGPGCVPSSANDNCGVHMLSGIPNKASALMVEALGWEKMKGIFYTVMTQKLTPDAQFQDYAREMLNTCAERLSPQECNAVFESLRAVGLR
ncbi:M4 family metallopeptidase [Bdellovibrio sp. HCB-162]|uniref:M4 family metallopeptidase n=1 Tax=Bdellovibrio sp. HCB-162 TaxID=3394234 RepID=UPI0039BCA4EC